MSEEQREIEVFEARRFTKALSRLPTKQLNIVEDEIEKIIANPKIGQQKTSDLSHLGVHKFKVSKQELLLGYSWINNELRLCLLSLGSHENFYTSE
ncbi:type II toxin-antitoxin system RelE/ParE family toxin [Photobacterium halotolerans]|uniref:Type II toxin-antitoxin system RelE/ParE family toxin n=1 Tax=Photobacterium halotolerans TaxID=265726 RepID=A0A7X4Y1J7_9GAMM|nr:type II toxin-antitoxin system RelE/ParE family toxin [Photobacterium halotolerans]NAW64080.1 type II toxin-antitoxin system RelE/ParE family toxin [Photobacterium halotolerans]NAW87694.1 type II toxin-antitoxin system RelE/ParE family toxin [Photobacterium halotolerans]NAX48076.1 type II toxin-antitoxin system RelE/ParE family toxin [Photobacterium halotolerans]